MKQIVTIVLPAALVFVAFRRGGVLPGCIALALYFLISILVKLPDMLMASGRVHFILRICVIKIRQP